MADLNKGIADVVNAGRAFVDAGALLTIRKYAPFVNPFDGYVFWLDTGQINKIEASLHGSFSVRQDESMDVLSGRATISVKDKISLIDEVEPECNLVAEWQAQDDSGKPLRFVFNDLARYKEAGDYHYQAELLTPEHEWAYIPVGGSFPKGSIFSNAFPAFLTAIKDLESGKYPFLKKYEPLLRIDEATGKPSIKFFQRYLSPLNKPLPYISMICRGVEEKQAQPYFSGDDSFSFQNQAQEEVTFSLHGLTNREAQIFLAFLMDYPNYFEDSAYGIAGSGVIFDNGYPINGAQSVSNDKEIRVFVNYSQLACADAGEKLILKAGLHINGDLIIWCPRDKNKENEEEKNGK